MVDTRIKTRAVASSTAGIILGLVAASVLLVVQNVDYWVEQWHPVGGQPSPVSVRLPAFSVYRTHLGQPADLVRRQVIVARGEAIEPHEDAEQARLVTAYYNARRRSQIGWPLGVFCLTLFGCFLFFAELRRAPGSSRLLRVQLSLMALVLFFVVGAKAYLLATGLPPHYYPMPAVVLLVAFLFGRREAFAVNLFVSTLFASLVGFDLSVFAVCFVTGYAGSRFLKQRKKRRAVVLAGSLSGWFGAVTILVLMLVFAGTIHLQDLFNPDYSEVLAALVGGVASGIVAWVFLGPVGFIVGEVSRNKLLDLQDLDHPILKKIREKAPGTWEHSRAMANLAEAAAASISADALLVRVGAYVHDAGKALTPEYFIENQRALDIPNPHDGISPVVSAECIFDHVVEGVTLLRKHRVPEKVVEFAYTHHGSGLLEYFWVKNMEEGNPEALKEQAFCYPGAKPTSRETAIVMIVDAVEAASRTIKPPEKHKFENLVQKIVFSKLGQGQLDDCGLSLGDLKAVITTVVDTLVNTYHARIEYPWQRQGGATTTTSQRIVQTGQHTTDTGSVSQTGPHPSGITESGSLVAPPSVTQTGPQTPPSESSAAVAQTGQGTSPSQTGQTQVPSTQTGQTAASPTQTGQTAASPTQTGQSPASTTQTGQAQAGGAANEEQGKPARPRHLGPLVLDPPAAAEGPRESVTRAREPQPTLDTGMHPVAAKQPQIVSPETSPPPRPGAPKNSERPRKRRRTNTDPGMGTPVVVTEGKESPSPAAPFPLADDSDSQPAKGQQASRKVAGSR